MPIGKAGVAVRLSLLYFWFAWLALLGNELQKKYIYRLKRAVPIIMMIEKYSIKGGECQGIRNVANKFFRGERIWGIFLEPR
ncbi:MAG: hypothetical protein NTV22_19260 [bacterium]|nr:hypothetical protein [bacterium]